MLYDKFRLFIRYAGIAVSMGVMFFLFWLCHNHLHIDEYAVTYSKPIMSKVESIETFDDYFIVHFMNDRKWKATKVEWFESYYATLKQCQDAKENDWDIRIWIDNKGQINQSYTDGQAILDGE